MFWYLVLVVVGWLILLVVGSLKGEDSKLLVIGLTFVVLTFARRYLKMSPLLSAVAIWAGEALFVMTCNAEMAHVHLLFLLVMVAGITVFEGLV